MLHKELSNRKTNEPRWRPTRVQELLLRAVLFDGEQAINAWHDWTAKVDINNIDHESQLLLPMLYKNLYRMGVQDPLMNIYKGVQRKTWAKNNLIFHELKLLLRSFRDAGIKVLLLKGAAMTLLYYKDYGIRAMEDVDILVPVEKAKESVHVLSGRGWKRRKDSGPAFNEKYPGMNKANHFTTASGIEIDLHWQLLSANKDRGSDEDFRLAAIPLRIDDTLTVHALNHTDQLFHLVVHGMQWNPNPLLRWVADAMMILKKEHDIDWSRLIGHAKKRQHVIATENGLNYLHHSFNAPVPRKVLEEIRQLKKSSFEYREFRFYNRPEGILAGLTGTWYRYRRSDINVSPLRRVPGFLRFLQYDMGAKYGWQLPYYFVVFSLRRVRTFLLPHLIGQKRR